MSFTEIKAFLDKTLNFLYCGGFEIHSPHFALLAKNLETNNIFTDVNNLVPMIDNSNSSLTDSLRIFLQLVLENDFSDRMNTIQFVENNNLQKIDTIKNAMRKVPEITLFQIKNVSVKNVRASKTLTILTEENNLNDVLQILKNNDFVLYTVNGNLEDHYLTLAKSLNLKVVMKRKNLNQTIYLLRKIILTPSNVRVIEASTNAKETLDAIKNINLTSENERILVIIKSKNVEHVAEHVNVISEDTRLDKIRIYHVPNIKTINDLVLKKQLELDLLVNVLTSDNNWATLRRSSPKILPKLSKRWIANQNGLYDVAWTEGPIVEKFENEVKVEYAALNPQDVLIANGKFDTDSSKIIAKSRSTRNSFGLEFSGTDQVGNRIMGIVNGNAMSNVVTPDSIWTWQIPKSWSFEDAATVPLSYVTAYAALVTKAKVKAGDKILLCCNYDGLGLAILKLAVKKQCDVFAIYETEIEKKLIQTVAPGLGNNRLYELSSSDRYLSDEISFETKRNGLDVLIICYHCESKPTNAFLNFTGKNTRVVSINFNKDKYLYEHIGMEPFDSEVMFSSIVLNAFFAYDDNTKKNLAMMLQKGIVDGTVEPLPRIVYNRDLLKEAFEACVARKNFEKVLISIGNNFIL